MKIMKSTRKGIFYPYRVVKVLRGRIREVFSGPYRVCLGYINQHNKAIGQKRLFEEAEKDEA